MLAILRRLRGFRRNGDDRGAVTAETAVVLPVLVLLAWVVLALFRVADAQLACQDAARAAARAASRGELPAVVEETGLRAAPSGAQVVGRLDGDLVAVSVTARVDLPGPLPLPVMTVTGRAVGVVEPVR